VASEFGKFASSDAPVAPTKAGTVYFFHRDHLESTSVVTTLDAQVHESAEYFVDGEMWLDRAPQNTVDEYLFSGKPFDPDTGFYDFGARFYEPRTSLWLGPDANFKSNPASVIGNPRRAAPLQFAAWSPVLVTDPDGREDLLSDLIKLSSPGGAAVAVPLYVDHRLKSTQAQVDRVTSGRIGLPGNWKDLKAAHKDHGVVGVLDHMQGGAGGRLDAYVNGSRAQRWDAVLSSVDDAIGFFFGGADEPIGPKKPNTITSGNTGGGGGGGRTVLNVGAGSNPKPGAINVDVAVGEGVDVVADANQLPFRTASVDEYNAVNPYGFNPVSAETARVVKPGGLVKVSGTPGNKFAKPMSPEAARAAGFEIVETGPLIEEHKFGIQRYTDAKPLPTDTSQTTIYRRLPN
jgi:RHS repeat-associated protein